MGRTLACIALSLFITSCAAAQKVASLSPLALAAEDGGAAAKAPTLLTENHFARDAMGTLSEAQLRDILQALSAWSGLSRGALNTTIIASPMYLSSVPFSSRTIWVIGLK